MSRTQTPGQHGASETGQGIKLALAWAFVGIPLIWGVVATLKNALRLFH